MDRTARRDTAHEVPPPDAIAAAKFEVASMLRREADLTRQIGDLEQERKGAALAGRIKAGEGVAPTAVADLAVAITAAENTAAALQDALRAARGATRKAEQHLIALLKDQVRKRLAEVTAEIEATQGRREELRRQHDRLSSAATVLTQTLAPPWPMPQPWTAEDLEVRLRQAEDTLT